MSLHSFTRLMESRSNLHFICYFHWNLMGNLDENVSAVFSSCSFQNAAAERSSSGSRWPTKRRKPRRLFWEPRPKSTNSTVRHTHASSPRGLCDTWTRLLCISAVLSVGAFGCRYEGAALSGERRAETEQRGAGG